MSNEKSSIEKIKNKIKDILEEPEIRFCGLIDVSGNLVAGDYRVGLSPLVTDEKQKMMFQELAHRVANRHGFDDELGRVKYSSSRREHVVMMSFPTKTHILLVIADPAVNIDRLAWKIIYKLDRQWSEFHGL